LAAIDFLEGGGDTVIITSPEYLKEAYLEKHGTIITK